MATWMALWQVARLTCWMYTLESPSSSIVSRLKDQDCAEAGFIEEHTRWFCEGLMTPSDGPGASRPS